MQITDRRTVPEVTGTPGKLAFKAADNVSGQMLALDDAEGIVTAIVSVTGTLDEVNDIILPGAYADTLVKRRPKVCWAHSWEHPIGRVLYIEELLPGDERLPSETKDGLPWPKEAGALVATMQFNMRTDEGKNAFEAVRFYSETGECEYSIGYQVPAGMASKDGKGVRHIKALDLYELSVVLFGAHTMTGTLSIKEALAAALERKAHRGQTGTVSEPVQVRSAKEALAAVRNGHKAHIAGTKIGESGNSTGQHVHMEVGSTTPEGKANPPAPPFTAKDKDEPPAKPPPPPKPEDEKPTDADDLTSKFADGVMIAVYPDPAAADQIARHIAGPDETVERGDLHVTLAYLGKDSEVEMTADEVFKRVSDALQGQEALTGEVGGIGQFPDTGDGAPTWVPVDVPGLSLLRETVVDALGDAVSTDHGFTPHMTVGYDIGLIDPIPPVPLTITEVCVVYGSQKRTITLAAADFEDKGMSEHGVTLNLDGSMSVSDVVRLTAIESLTFAPEGEVKAEGGADRNRGGAEELRRYWTTGEGGVEIAWNTPGDFTRCVGLLSEHMTPERAKGYCANRHKEMTGMWPGDRDNTGDEGKAAAYDPALETKIGLDTPSPAKGFPFLPGSFEERRNALETAVQTALRGDQDEDGKYEWDWVSIDATYEDRVIATRQNYDDNDRETYEMTYTHRPDGSVDLGPLDKVELQVVAVDAEGNEDDEAYVGDALPLAERVTEFAAMFKAAHAASIETKAGRVLSGANERRLREAVQHLVDVLAAAGVNLVAEGDDTNPDPDKPGSNGDERKPIDPAVDMSTTSPSASTKVAVIAEDDETVTLDFEAMQAEVKALTEGLSDEPAGVE